MQVLTALKRRQHIDLGSGVRLKKVINSGEVAQWLNYQTHCQHCQANIHVFNGFVTGYYIIFAFIFHHRIVGVVDSVKARLTDPCITWHWSSVGFDTATLATFHITSPEVGHLARLVCYRMSLGAISIKLWSG